METAAVKKLKEDFGYKNDLAIPKIEKIVINIGVGRMSQQPNFEDRILPEIMKELALITGQKPAPTKAKKSIAGFKTRSGQTIGMKVILRRSRMRDFLKRLISVVIPRLRDFKGIDVKNIDKSGNLNIGFRDHLVFPEINPEESKVDFGLEVSIVSNAKSRKEAVALYKALGVPLKKD